MMKTVADSGEAVIDYAQVVAKSRIEGAALAFHNGARMIKKKYLVHLHLQDPIDVLCCSIRVCCGHLA